ncbi:hypothetical protein CDCA_CDCA09G2584 [Cyanidium caldarium]|uniref:Spindle pole body component n=1 Tax=Cyanidium caldarium TaxID=2771 RepID=A0AAV9IW93_CYACA|nr:hypothetical protein CDCA_CDCA09G2584 [Cyanidium caldarium]
MPRASLHLTRSVAEAGWLYGQRIKPYLEWAPPYRAGNPDGTHHGDLALPMTDSLTRRSLVAAMHAELAPYHQLLEQLEAEALRGHLSLRVLAARVFPFRRGLLRWLAMVVDAVSGLSGGPLLSALYRLEQRGDPQLQALMRQLRHAASRPLQQMCWQWMQTARLEDPHDEFFIGRTDQSGHEGELRPERRPCFLAPAVAARMLGIGGSRAFLQRYAAPGTAPAAPTTHTDIWPDSAPLLRHLAQQVDVRQWLLAPPQRLVQHLEAHRAFVLLLDGEFCTMLMDTLADELSQRTADLSHSVMAGAVSAAVRTCSADHADRPWAQEVDERLDVSLLAESATPDRGWDAFALTYTFPEPVARVLTAHWESRAFRQAPQFMWMLRRAQFGLDRAWLDMQKLHQAVMRWCTGHRPRDTQTAPELSVLQRCWRMRQQLAEFVQKLLQQVCRCGLEPAWQRLLQQLQRPVPDADVEEVKRVLAAYRQHVIAAVHLDGDAAAEDHRERAGSSLPALQATLRLVFRFLTLYRGIHFRTEQRIRTLGYDDPVSVVNDLAELDTALQQLHREWHTQHLPPLQTAWQRSARKSVRQLAQQLASPT